MGAAGLILLLLTIWRALKRDFKEQKLVGWGFAGSSSLISLALIVVLLAFFPGGTVSTVMLFIFLSLNAKAETSTINLSSEVKSKKAKVQAGISSRLPALLISA